MIEKTKVEVVINPPKTFPISIRSFASIFLACTGPVELFVEGLARTGEATLRVAKTTASAKIFLDFMVKAL